jgi:hypothetical protein
MLDKRKHRGAAAAHDLPARIVVDLNGRLAGRLLDLRAQLGQLGEERLCAREVGLDRDRAYIEDLELEVAEARTMFTGAAVLQLAALRASLDGALRG